MWFKTIIYRFLFTISLLFSIVSSDNISVTTVTTADTTKSKPLPAHVTSTVMVISRTGSKMEVCSGSLLSTEWVLTAGSCLFYNKNRVSDLQVYAGGSNLQEVAEGKLAEGSQIRNISKGYTYVHPDYECCGSSSADLALIKVTPKFNVTESVSIVPLSPKPLKAGEIECTVTGYGADTNTKFGNQQFYVHGEKTRKISVTKKCECNYRAKILEINTEFRIICEKREKGTRNLAYGDFGAGLICSGKVHGVFSSILEFSDKCIKLKSLTRANTVCGVVVPYSANYFSDTCKYITWINNHIKVLAVGDIDSECGSRGSASLAIELLLFTAPLVLTLL